MLCPSITATLGCVFLAYISYSMWMLARLFTSLECTSLPCYKYFLESKPKMQLALFTASNSNPISSETRRIYSNASFDFEQKFEKDFVLEIPLKTRLNGSLYMQVVLALEGESLEWKTLRREGPTVIHSLPLTEYVLPQAEAFVLLNTDQAITASRDSRLHKTNVVAKPVSHIMPHVHVVLLTDNISVSPDDVPLEMGRLIRVNQNQQIMPILKTDYFNTRTKDLVKLTRDSTKFNITFHYKPISIGKLRFMLSIEHAMNAFLEMGFTKKDADEFKGMFSDTNVYLLCGTFFVASIHLLFDFLAFKNDVNFWRKKNSYEGLSARTILWRTFSQLVIFAYLIDEGTSMLVLIPSGLGTLIEIWKCKKIFNINFGFDRANGKSDSDKKTDTARSQTEEFDKQGMRYLSYLLYPLCFAGSIYSLVYQPHKNWYSWTLSSLVNCVYAFGFLFMLPQLFINYKLKSVAALPWRAFMYKAFNTFIDDIFAFIITMPTAHRVACLRDDVVFIIYLYQRWLYPVDKNRVDTDSVSAGITNTIERTEENEKKEQ